MRWSSLLAVLLAASLSGAIAGCGAPSRVDDVCSTQTRSMHPRAAANHTLVALANDGGCIVVELFDDIVPVTAANFRRYVEEGFYTDMRWHHIQPGFLSQTGAIQANGAEKAPTHPVIPNESGRALAAGLHNDVYTLAMVYVSAPKDYDSAATQFFINMDKGADGKANRILDASSPTQNDGWCPFAKILSGQGLADRINGRTDPARPPVLVSARILS